MRTKARKKKKTEKLNLIPILDAVFIFIFFLLMSAQFLEIYEIGSDLPVVTDAPPPKDKVPLNLTLRILPEKIIIETGMSGQVLQEIEKNSSGKYDLMTLHKKMYELKRENIKENAITFTPSVKVKYAEIITIMDAVREISTDEKPFKVESENGKERVERKLFNQIIFSNLTSS